MKMGTRGTRPSERCAELPVIVGAGGHARFELPVRHGWYEQRGQNANDADHYQQLDQCESLFDAPISCHNHFDS